MLMHTAKIFYVAISNTLMDLRVGPYIPTRRSIRVWLIVRIEGIEGTVKPLVGPLTLLSLPRLVWLLTLHPDPVHTEPKPYIQALNPRRRS
jgi:hypothetical protein